MSNIQPVLPSKQRLLKATVIAMIVAAIILVVAVLPAEYGIDPTGIGARLGLTALAGTETPGGEAPPVAKDPAIVAADPSANAAEPELDAVGQPAKPIEGRHVVKRDDIFRSDEMTVILGPGKGAEIKATMQAGAGMVFGWTASAPVAVDMHGERKDAKEGEYTSYWIERSQEQGFGSFTAPFDGSHGWYWLNRSDAPVTVNVQVTGFQEGLFVPGGQ